MALKKRKDKWLATVFRGYEPQANGRVKRLEHAKTFAKKKDAERWLREQNEAVDRGTWSKPSEMLLRDYLKQWREGALILGSQRDRTKQSYNELLATYIEPKLSGTRLDRLTKPVVQKAAAELLAQPITRGGKPIVPTDDKPVPTLSPVTVRRALAALGVALRDAVEQRLIPTNPAVGIALPRAQRYVPRWLTRDEVVTLIGGTVDDRHGVLWTLIATTGLRPSEALALQWDCVDLVATSIHVRQTLVPQNKEKTGTTWKLEEPKTRRSRRAVTISVEMVRTLRRHHAKQSAERLATGGKYLDHGGGGFVFAHPNGAPYREDGLMQLFRRTVTRLSLPAVTLYSLRHGHASLLLEAGVPLKVVSERLGHSSIQLTADTYTHVSDAMQQRAIEQFNAYLTATPTVKEALR